MRDFWHHHKWEVILGLVFAVLFGLVWEAGKHTLEHAEHVSPDRLGAGTVRVMTAIRLRNDAQRQVVAEWTKEHPSTVATDDFAIVRWGSGFAVSDEGWIVTANHVVNMNAKSLAPLLAKTGEKPFLIVLYPPRVERNATLIESDAQHDTAILKAVNAPPNTFLVIGNPEETHRLDRVFAAGYPSAADFSDPFEPTMTAGEITKASEEERYGKVFQITAPIGPGNSGGPLLDEESHVVGINVGTPANDDLPIAFAVSIEHAAKMLEKRGVALPSSYETQGILRQPLVVWTTILAAVALFFAYFGVSLRSFWRRRIKVEGKSARAGFWIRFVALVLDLAIVIPIWLLLIVLVIVATDEFLPWYGFVIGALLAWWLYAVVFDRRWGATIGKRVAGLRRGEVVNRRSPWAMLLLGAFAFLFTLVCVFVHWGFLSDRAMNDLEMVHARAWAPAKKVDASLLTRAMDRGAFLRWTPPLRSRAEVMYGYGLDLMLRGRPREALDALRAAAGSPWETFASGTGVAHTSTEWDAATKAGWCYFDAGDVRRARELFEMVGSDHNLDAALGVAVTSMWLNDRDAARAACAKARAIDALAVERLRRSNARYPVPAPFYLTPTQLRAVQQTLAACGDAR